VTAFASLGVTWSTTVGNTMQENVDGIVVSLDPFGYFDGLGSSSTSLLVAPAGPAGAPNNQSWKDFGKAIKSCAAKSFLPAAAGAGALAAGSNVVSTAGKFAGSTPGTSLASQFFRSVLPQTIKSTWAPTLMNPLAETSVLGGVVGRWVPILGEALLIKSGADVLSCVWDSDSNY
jgi:hypothetical protein